MSTAQIVLEGDAYHNFINSLQTEATKEGYRHALVRFMKYFQIKDTDTLIKLPRQDIESYLIKYFEQQRQSNRSKSSMEVVMFAVQHFCIINDILINIKKISKFKRSLKNKNTDFAYSHAEILKLTSVMPFRIKVCVMIFASTGIRKGALPPLRLRNLKKIDNLYKFTIYEGDREEYTTFCTPECASLIDSYLDFRTRSGEKLTPESYLIREDFDINDLDQIRKESRSVSHKTLANSIASYMIKAGLREINHNYLSQFDRKPIPLIHGFRKYFTTQLVNSKLNPEIREMLLGHKIGLASAYYRPSEEVMYQEYSKAINKLTINEEDRLKMRVEQLEVEKTQFQSLAAEIELIKREIRTNK
jgi:integrase